MISLRGLLSKGDRRIGPGRLILVVGPSGAGKDTLIAIARDALRGDPQFVFARRVVTRSASPFEDNDSLGEAEFDRAAASGSFAFWWEAHGHRYGVPRSIDGDIRAGRTVVCNTSRAIVPGLRDDYARVTVVLVTAPSDVLEARLAGRMRQSDGAGRSRIERRHDFQETLLPEIVICNTGEAKIGARALVDAVMGRRALSDFPPGYLL
jgi:ribose 1,5-bisphosphokinase